MAREPAALVAEAGDEVQAQIWLAALRDAGIKAATFEVGVGAALGGAVTGTSRYPILVERRDLVNARNIIAELDGASRLAPVRDPLSQPDQGSRKALALALVSATIIAVGALIGRLLVG